MKRIGICSGYFNPLTKAHVACFKAARQFCDELYVIVNNDKQVELKGSIPFQDENERQYIINSLECVTEAIIAEEWHLTVDATISSIVINKTDFNEEGQDILFFINGGDRVSPSDKELDVCKHYDMITVYGVGGYEKAQSSSKLIEQAAKEWHGRQKAIDGYFNALSNGAFNEKI